MDEWVWSNGGMILTGETEVLGEKHYTAWVVDGWMGMEQWWNDTDRGNWNTGRKSVVVLILSPQFLQRLLCYRISSYVLRRRQMTGWSCSIITVSWRFLYVVLFSVYVWSGMWFLKENKRILCPAARLSNKTTSSWGGIFFLKLSLQHKLPVRP